MLGKLKKKKKIMFIICLIILLIGLGIADKRTASIIYSCVEGWTLGDDKKCYKTVYADPEIKYTCSSGYSLKDTKCYK